MDIWLILDVLLYLFVPGWTSCDCGRGGLCYDYGPPITNGTNAEPCHCEEVSKGIFMPSVSNCNTLINYCNESTCKYGNCIPGFGTFICNCTVKNGTYGGHTCEETPNPFRGSLTGVWYSVVGQRSWDVTFFGNEYMEAAFLSFELDYGRVTSAKSCQNTSEKQALANCRKYGDGSDCDVVEKLTAITQVRVTCTIDIPYVTKRNLYIKGHKGPVGQYHDVRIKYYDGFIENFNVQYRVFIETGPLARVCPFDVKTAGCGEKPTTAVRIPLDHALLMSTAAVFEYDNPKKACPKVINYTWAIGSFYNGTRSIVGHEQTLSVVLLGFGYRKGIYPIFVTLTFLEIINIGHESVTAVCFVEIIEPFVDIRISEYDLTYKCGSFVDIMVKPVLFNSVYSESEFTYQWYCNRRLCSFAKRNKRILKFRAKMNCLLVYKIKLIVSHTRTLQKAEWEGPLIFELPTRSYMYPECTPPCRVVDNEQTFSIRVIEKPHVSTKYNWSSEKGNISEPYNCREAIPTNFLMLPPNVFLRNDSFMITVKSSTHEKQIKIFTVEGPTEFNCSISPVEPKSSDPYINYKLECSTTTRNPPIEYWVFQGSLFNHILLTVSMKSSIELEITESPVTVIAVESTGARSSSLSLEVTLNLTQDEIIGRATSRLNTIETAPLSYHSVVNTLYSITRIRVDFTNSLKSRLIKLLIKGQCRNVDCVAKLTTTLELILDNIGSDTGTEGVDEFLLEIAQFFHTLIGNLPKMTIFERWSLGHYFQTVVNAIHNALMHLLRWRDPALTDPYIHADLRRIHYLKVTLANSIARSAIAEIVLFVTMYSPYPNFPVELKTKGDGMTLILANDPEYINCILKTKTEFHLEFAEEWIDDLRVNYTEVSVALVTYPEQFWWMESNNEQYGELGEVIVYQRERQSFEWNFTEEFIGQVDVYLKLSLEDLPFESATGVIDEPGTGYKLHRMSVPRGKGVLILKFPEVQLNQTYIRLKTSVPPGMEEMRSAPIVMNTTMFYHYVTDEPEDVVYVGITSDQNTTYSFNVSRLRCITRSEDIWKSESCRFSSSLKLSVVLCRCAHLSLLSVEAVAPKAELINYMNLSLDSHLGKSTNSFAVIAIVAVLVFAFLVLVTALLLSVLYRSNRFVIFLDDNYPGERFPYLVGVFTGGRCMAGTTSKVALRLKGTKSTSRVHILANPSKATTMSWAQDSWFLLFTRRDLGRVYEIEMWHNGAGTRPDWYCTEVIVYAHRTGRKYNFLVKTWLTYTVLHEYKQTTFAFSETFEKRKRWTAHFKGHLLAYTREEGWASVYMLHSRSLFTRFDRSAILIMTVVVAMSISLAFYSEDVGPSDAPFVTLTQFDLLVAMITLLATLIIISVPAQLFRIGKNFKLGDTSEVARQKLIRQFSFIPRYFVRAITNMPVMTKNTYKNMRRRYQLWTLFGYLLSLVIILASVSFFLAIGWGLNKNRSLVWIVVLTLALCGLGLIVNLGLASLFAAIVSCIIKIPARHVYIINVEAQENTYPTENFDERLAFAKHHRVKPIYKPPLSSNIKLKVLGSSRRVVAKVYLICITVLLMVLIVILVGEIEIEMTFYKNRNLVAMVACPNISTVMNLTSYFGCLRATLIPALHRNKWYNGHHLPLMDEPLSNTTTSTGKYRGVCADYTTKLIGVLRLRQHRISPYLPQNASFHFRNVTNHSYPYLSTLNKDTTTYLPNWQNVVESMEGHYRTWRYWSDKETKTGVMSGSTFYHEGDGYVEHLHWSLDSSLSHVVDLEKDHWIDNMTRAVILSLNLYDGRIATVSMITEVFPSGVYSTRVRVESVLMPWRPWLVALLAIAIIIHLARAISKRGIDCLNLAMVVSGFLAVIALAVQYVVEIDEIETRWDEYTSLYTELRDDSICIFLVSIFSLLATASCALLVRRLTKVEELRIAQRKAWGMMLFMCVVLAVISSIAVLSFYYFGAVNDPDFKQLLFKEMPREWVGSLPLYNSVYMMAAGLIFTFWILILVAASIYCYKAAVISISRRNSWPSPFIIQREISSKWKEHRPLRVAAATKLNARNHKSSSRSDDEVPVYEGSADREDTSNDGDINIK